MSEDQREDENLEDAGVEIPDEEPETRYVRVKRRVEPTGMNSKAAEPPAASSPSPELQHAVNELAYLEEGPVVAVEEHVIPANPLVDVDGQTQGRQCECRGAPRSRLIPGPQKFSERQQARIKELMDQSAERRKNQDELIRRRKKARARSREEAAKKLGHPKGTGAKMAGGMHTLEVGQLPEAEGESNFSFPGSFEAAQWNTAMGPTAVGYYLCQVKPPNSGRVLYYSNGFDMDGPAEGWRWDQVERLIVMIPGSPDKHKQENEYLSALIPAFGHLDSQFEGVENAKTYAILLVALPEAFPVSGGENPQPWTPPFQTLTWSDNIPGPLRGTEDLDRNNVVTWHKGQHGSGYDTPNKGIAGNISIFDVIDCLIDRSIERFDNLKQIYVLGHSSGGQSAHRYAAADSRTEAREGIGIFTRYISMNPGYYSFFNPGRLTYPQMVADGIYNQNREDGDPEEISTPDQIKIEHFDWYQDPLSAQMQAGVDQLTPGVNVALECEGYDLKGGARGFSTDLTPELMRSFADAAEELYSLNWDDGEFQGQDFPEMLKLFAQNYFWKDVWHLQAQADDEVNVKTAALALMGPTRCHRWWSLRQSILRWNLNYEPDAAKRFYLADSAGSPHSGEKMFKDPVFHVAVDILPEEGSGIEQFRNAIPDWFS